MGGSYPYAGVIRDPAGNLYGTTAWGGDLNCLVYLEPGCGLVYKLEPAGNYTVLYSSSGESDGAIPDSAGVVRDTAGNLYGTTAYGGNYGATPYGGPFYVSPCTNPAGCGVVFSIDTAGQLTVLYGFTGSTDGAYPNAGLVNGRAAPFLQPSKVR